MELKATSLGKRLAQHPYDRAVILNAGVKVSGDRHEYLIPFNQLLAIHCKRGLVWGELEFVLPEDKSCVCTVPSGRNPAIPSLSGRALASLEPGDE